MRQYLQLVFVSLFTISLQAQAVLTIEPGLVQETFTVDLSNEFLDLEVHATVANTTSEELQLKWTRSVVDKPDAWRSQVCDNNTCYTPQVSTNYDPDNGINEPVILPANSSFELIFHVLPNQMDGSGEFNIDFYLIDGPDSLLANVTFVVDVVGTTSVSEPSKQKIKAYPNPAQNYIELTHNSIVDQVVVYNVVGRMVKTFEAANGKKYDIGELPDGLYLVSLMNNEEGIIKTIRMSKRSLRP